VSLYQRILVVGIVALSLGGFASAAQPQSACIVEAGLVCENDERRAPSLDSPTVIDPGVSVGTPTHRREQPWRVGPGAFGDGARAGWMMDGAAFTGPDGRTCWPHGDHVHCR
jgi:hypothetical protein